MTEVKEEDEAAGCDSQTEVCAIPQVNLSVTCLDFLYACHLTEFIF